MPHLDTAQLIFMSLVIGSVAPILALLALLRLSCPDNQARVTGPPRMGQQARPHLPPPHDVCVALTRGCHTPNQDACAASPLTGGAVVAVADGVGETGPMSQFVARAAVEHVVMRRVPSARGDRARSREVVHAARRRAVAGAAGTLRATWKGAKCASDVTFQTVGLLLTQHFHAPFRFSR